MVEYIVAIDVTRVRFPADAGVLWATYLQKIACAPEFGSVYGLQMLEARNYEYTLAPCRRHQIRIAHRKRLVQCWALLFRYGSASLDMARLLLPGFWYTS